MLKSRVVSSAPASHVLQLLQDPCPTAPGSLTPTRAPFPLLSVTSCISMSISARALAADPQLPDPHLPDPRLTHPHLPGTAPPPPSHPPAQPPSWRRRVFSLHSPSPVPWSLEKNSVKQSKPDSIITENPDQRSGKYCLQVTTYRQGTLLEPHSTRLIPACQ